jgi:hypothetical protein
MQNVHSFQMENSFVSKCISSNSVIRSPDKSLTFHDSYGVVDYYFLVPFGKYIFPCFPTKNIKSIVMETLSTSN